MASSFKWPAQKNDLWLERKSVLCVIEAPIPIGKTGHAFHLTEATIALHAEAVCILSLALNRLVFLH